MSGDIRRAVLVGIIVTAPHLGLAQDREYPVLNSVGRYLGIGYTRGGYHAPNDGRIDIVTARHAASDYRCGGFPPYAGSYFHSAENYSVAPEGNQAPWAAAPATIAPTPALPSPRLEGVKPVSPEVTSSLRQPLVAPHLQPGMNSDFASVPVPGLATPQVSAAIQAPHATQHDEPAVLNSPKDRIEVRELAPEASPSDTPLDSGRTQPLPVQGVTFSIIEPGRDQQKAREMVPAAPEPIAPQLIGQGPSGQIQPPVPATPRRHPAPPIVNRYQGPAKTNY